MENNDNKEMTIAEALQVYEDLIKSVMARGGFKSFEPVDKCRQSLNILREKTKDKE